MTRQTINLLGGLVVVVILVVGVLLGALPHWRNAQDADARRTQVALENRGQEVLIATYAKQRPELPQLQAQVAALKQQIATGPHFEQVIELASGLPSGAVLRSITPQSDDTAGAAAAAPVGGFTSLPVTIVVDVRQAADAATVLDKLRAGPRLLAVDHVTLAGGAGSAKGGSTLTVTGRVFVQQAVTP